MHRSEGTKEASMQIKAGARIIKRGLDIAPLHTQDQQK